MLNVSVSLRAPPYSMETFSFLRSLVADENVIQSLHLNFAILSCLSPPEATELLEHIRCGSPYLNQVHAWEYFMQSPETSTSQQRSQTLVNGLTSGMGIPSLGTVTNELSCQHFNTPKNHSKPQCPQPPTQDESIACSSANDMRKLQTSGYGFGLLDDDPVQWGDWLLPEINWGNLSLHLSKSGPSDEPETVVSQQGMFGDKLQFEDRALPDEVDHAQRLPSSPVPLLKSSVEESHQCKLQSESPKCMPALLSDIFSSPGSNIDNETQISEDLGPGDLNTSFSANREECRIASVALPTGLCKNKKKQAQIRKVSPIAELEGAIEAEFLDQDSVVSFGRCSPGGTNRIPDLRGAPTVDDRATTLIRSFKAATGKSLTISQAEDVKDACDKQFLPDDLLEFLSVDLGWSNLNRNWDQQPPEIIPPEFVSSRAACVAYYRALLTPKRDQISAADNIRCRITQIWLHLFFEGFVRELTEGEKDGSLVFPRNKRQISTIARDFILNDIYGVGFQPQQKYRSALHSETRWGDRWWRVASCNGLGALLFVSGDLADNIGKRTGFQVAMIDALAIYILNTYPRLVSLFRSFQPITLNLMFGRGFPHLSQGDTKALLDLLNKPDLCIQNYPDTWQEIDIKMASVSAASDLMRIQRKYFQSEAEAAGVSMLLHGGGEPS